MPSCPPAHAPTRYDAGGRWLGSLPLREACALAVAPGRQVYAAGLARLLDCARPAAPLALTGAAKRLDKHWDWAGR